MSRDSLDAATRTALGQPHVTYLLLLQLDFASGTQSSS